MLLARITLAATGTAMECWEMQSLVEQLATHAQFYRRVILMTTQGMGILGRTCCPEHVCVESSVREEVYVSSQPAGDEPGNRFLGRRTSLQA